VIWIYCHVIFNKSAGQHPQSSDADSCKATYKIQPQHKSKMLRPAMQCVRGAVKAVSCSRAAVPQPFKPRSLLRSSQFVPVLSISGVRCYSAEAGGMQKSEVVGRIMELLKGFDKVCCQKNYKMITKGDIRSADQRSRQSSYNHNPSKISSLSSMQLTANSHFSNDLGLDSLDTVEVVMAIEEVSLSMIRNNKLGVLTSL